MNDFLKGMLVMGGLAAAMLFVKCWRKSGDRLFLYFACCFAMLAFNWLMLTVVPADEQRAPHFVIRIVAFGLLIAGILDKNWRRQARVTLPQCTTAEPPRPPPPAAPR